MKLNSTPFLFSTILLFGCVEGQVEVPLAETVLLKSVAAFPTKGDSLQNFITEERYILDALEEFREIDLATSNLNDLSKLKNIRESYANSLVGSGAVFALVPNIERDYRIRVIDGTQTVSVTLPKYPYLFYVCSEVKLDENHYDTCEPHSADNKTSLAFHGDLNLEAFELEIPAGIVRENSESLQSVYFVSFELPSKAMDSLSPHAFTKSESKGKDIHVTDWKYSYNEAGYLIFDGATLKGISGRTIVGNFHGVAFVDKMSGEVLVSKPRSAQ